jgi:hypothetical protein
MNSFFEVRLTRAAEKDLLGLRVLMERGNALYLISVGAGLQQAIEYAKALDVPYVYASNGDGFVEQNLLTGEVKELKLKK